MSWNKLNFLSSALCKMILNNRCSRREECLVKTLWYSEISVWKQDKYILKNSKSVSFFPFTQALPMQRSDALSWRFLIFDDVEVSFFNNRASILPFQLFIYWFLCTKTKNFLLPTLNLDEVHRNGDTPSTTKNWWWWWRKRSHWPTTRVMVRVPRNRDAPYETREWGENEK